MKSTVTVVLIGLAAWAQGSAQPGAVATRPEDLCAVAGQVVNASTGEPLRKASVTLRRADAGPAGGPRAYAATTDASGGFAITGVEPGQYRLSARRTGFVDVAYGTRDHLKAGSPLKLSAGQKLDNLRLSMPPNAVIAGKLVDEDGDPMAGVDVEALRLRYTQGRKQLSSYGSGVTNDIGEYRIAGLPAGRYFIAATARRGGFGPARSGRPAAAAESDEYVRTFYPGSADAASAAPLDATPGAVLRGVDLAMAKGRTVTLRGRVTDASGVSAQGGRSRVMVSLYPRQLGAAEGNRPSGVDAAGNFEIRGVAAGAYDLVAAIPQRGSAVSARLPLQVGHSSLDNLRIVINPPLNLTGVVRIDSQTVTLPAGVQVSLRAREAGGQFSGSTDRTAKAAADGSFTLAGVNPERYSLSLAGIPDGCYVKSVRLGGQEAAPGDLDLARAGGGTLEIVVSPTAGLVAGVVQNDQQQPAAGASVVLVPQEPERRELPQYYRTATADDTGHFTVNSVEPGQYRVYAWPEVEAGAYLDPDFLRPVESHGEPVTVRESGQETVQVKLIG